MERVQKLISATGYCSRRKAEELIQAGRVKVNGRTVAIGASAERTDRISVDGRPLRLEKKIYLLLNKPKGFVCSRDDPVVKKTIYKLVNLPERVYSVGRLDIMSEGLLILTNDGEFANRIMHPRYEVPKTYQVVLDRPFELEKKHFLARGMVLPDGKGGRFKTSPAHVSVDPKDKRNVYVTLHEGKNRVVRRMFHAIGYKTFKLVRVKIGPLKIEGLQRGRWRELTEAERQALLQPSGAGSRQE
jgi:23S rRNA pseudouridine2605 synthase